MEQINTYDCGVVRDKLWGANRVFGPLFDYYYGLGGVFLSCWEPQYRVKGRLGDDLFWEFYEY